MDLLSQKEGRKDKFLEIATLGVYSFVETSGSWADYPTADEIHTTGVHQPNCIDTQPAVNLIFKWAKPAAMKQWKAFLLGRTDSVGA